MKRILKNLSLMLAILISLCSCIDFIWVNPISDVQDAKVDKRLIGTWFGKNEDDKAKINIYHIYQMDKHSMYVYAMKEMDAHLMQSVATTEPDMMCVEAYYKMHVCELEGRTFLNLRSYTCSSREFSKYGILEYEFIDENEVSFYPTDPKFVKEAIDNGRLSGEITGDIATNITATSLEIREFIKNSPKEELFDRDHPLILKKFERPKDTKRSICILF